MISLPVIGNSPRYAETAGGKQNKPTVHTTSGHTSNDDNEPEDDAKGSLHTPESTFLP